MSPRPRSSPAPTGSRERSPGPFFLLGAASVLAYVGLLGAVHFRSVASEPGRWLDGLRGYWGFLDRHVVSLDRLRAAHEPGRNLPEALAFTACLAAASVLYVLLVRRLRRNASAPRLGALIGLTVACALPLVALPNVLSTDLFLYIEHGRVYAVHGANPYVVPPAAFPDDPYLSLVFWQENTSPYGPVWTQVSGLLTAAVEAVGGGLATYVLAYKGLALALHLLAGALIWRIATGWNPERRALAAGLYLLNPLCLMEFAGSGHNDALMIVWVLLGVLAFQEGRWLPATAAAALAALTKLYALPVLGLFIALSLWTGRDTRGRLLRLAGSVAVCLGIGVALYARFWAGWATLSIAGDPSQRRALHSLGEVIGNALFGLYVDLPGFFLSASRLPLHAALRNVALLIPAAVFALGLWWARDLRRTVGLAAWGFFAFCTVGAVWFWPWYVTLLVALAAVSLHPAVAGPAVLLSLLAPLIYVVHAWVGEAGLLRPLPSWAHRYKPLVIFLPPLAWAAAALVRSWRDRRARNTGIGAY